MQSRQPALEGKPSAPSPNVAAPVADDKRWKLVNATMRRHGYQSHALIETLHTVQEAFGYLDDDSLRYVSAALKVPYSKVYGVATFYHFFTLKPQGEHTCVVCMGTACYIKGAPALLAGIREAIGVESGQTTDNGRVSVLSARCIGSCGLAPAVVLDGEVAGRMNAKDLKDRLAGWMASGRAVEEVVPQ
ncbi:MAG TPA: bidirectional hydrogenase complex protein HoxE [Armatimonadota bacterium]